MPSLVRILVTIGGGASIGFGVWHFFVPTLWKWYSYIDGRAAELILAVRAINIFFSLCLALLGIVNVLFVLGRKSNRDSIIIMLAATSVLWVTRVVLQVIHPQGSMNPAIQYGMLAAFVVISLCFLFPLGIILSSKTWNDPPPA